MDKRIILSGFSDLDLATKDIIEKNLTKQLPKLEHYTKNLRQLKLTLKIIHKKEKGELYDVSASLNDNGTIYNSNAQERNLLSVVVKVLEKLRNELS
tara:strand:+ start:182 stop:472 length:291 start_codon:yes stop_codon:yes gene_type:complete